jgi:hypothetical protein
LTTSFGSTKSVLAPLVVHSDRHGIILEWASPRIVEVQWLRTTDAMTGVDFWGFMDEFIIQVEGLGAPGALIDETHFRMPPERLSSDWAASEFVPRCNAAGLLKLAAVNPSAASAPLHRAPLANYLRAAFTNRNQALSWLR